MARKHGSLSGEEGITGVSTNKKVDCVPREGCCKRRRSDVEIFLASCRRECEKGMEEDNLIFVVVRPGYVPSAETKHYNHTGGAEGSSSHSKSLRDPNSCKVWLPCCNLLLFFLWIESSSSFPNFPSFSSSVQFLASLFPIFSISTKHFIRSFPTFSSFLSPLSSSIMDSLVISASWTGPCAPGASQAVLIPAPEESSRQS